MEGAVDAFATLLAQRLAEALEPLILRLWTQQPVRQEQLPPTMSATEAGEFLGIGRNAVYEAVHRGDLPSLRISSRIRIPTHALLKKLESLA
jgi:excisionase family DNA binding protein